MPIKILMPALSPTMTEGNLVKWLKKEGDNVRSGEVIAEIETDKATMEVEAADDGTIGSLLVAAGTPGVKVNTPIALLLGEGEDVSALESASVAAPATAPAQTVAASAVQSNGAGGAATGRAATPLAGRMAQQAGIDIATIAGSGPGGRIVKADIEAVLGGGHRAAPAPAATKPDGGRIFASPLARRLAGEASLDLATVQGSGPQGRIVKADVEAAVAAGGAIAGRVAKPLIRTDGVPEFELVPHSTMRRVIAERLTESKQQVPHFYLSVDCEIDELLRILAELNARNDGLLLTINDFVIRAVALALMKVPGANVAWTDEGLRLYKSADVSVAVAVYGGLITPVVRAAETKGLSAISAEVKDLATRARAGKLMPEEYQGGTFTISNLGMYGIREFAAIINPPQACILAVGRGGPRPVVRDGELAVANVMTCTLSVDHRAVDGAMGAQYLQAFKQLIEFPAAMML